jgi:DNA-binding transcriptional MerR regulator/methylmalonyl-CoA mutase cobalamin-binding subunit
MLQPPALEAYSDRPLFNTKAVVHQTGVPAPTLRAWERRYGILAPRRGENDYRLYSERDIATITWLREHVQSGMTISQAIALLKSLEMAHRQGRKAAHSGPADGNGHAAAPVVAVPASVERFSAEQLQSLLLQQLAGLDEPGATRTIAQALAIQSVEDVCLLILGPVLHEIGRRWAAGELSVTIEHFSAALVRAQLESLFRSASATESGPLVFVGCAPDELHELGSLMLALFLRRGGFRVIYLGQSVDDQGLVTAVATLRPAAVLLSATQPSQAARLASVGQQLLALTTTPPLFVYGGQAFERSPELASQVPGVFVDGNAGEAVRELRKRLPA